MSVKTKYPQKNLKPDFSAALEKSRQRYGRRRFNDEGQAGKSMPWLMTFTDVMALMLNFRFRPTSS